MNTHRNILFPALLCSAVCAAASVRWLATEHDFGAFNEDVGPVTAHFRFVNTGPDAVSILAARASCGCTSPEYPRAAIEPGDTATISVTYNPSGRPGAFSKYVQVELTDPSARKSKLYVKGTVVGNEGSVSRRFPVETGRNVNFVRPAVMFGQVKKGSLRTNNFEAYNASFDTLSPLVTSAPDYITVDFAPSRPAPGEQFTMLFYLHSDRSPLYGMITDSVSVDWGRGAYSIPIVAMVEEDFSGLTPEEIAKAPVATVEPSFDFGTVGRELPLKASIKVKNDGQSPLRIRRVYSTDPGITATISSVTIKPGKSAEIKVEVSPEALHGDMLNARVMLITNDPGRSTVPIRLVGELK